MAQQKTRKPGRPPRAGKPALERVEFRATSAELAAWTAKAERVDVSLSEWIRQHCNGAR